MRILGNTVGFPNPQTNWDQTDSALADYLQNKPEGVGAGSEVVSGELKVENQKYTLTMPLEDGSIDVVVLDFDADGYISKVTVNGKEIPWTVTGV